MRPFGTQIAKLTDHLFLCGIGCITVGHLESRHISHILNTAEELKDFKYPILNEPTIVKHILMRDFEDENLLTHLDICVDYVHTISKANGNILVHCVAGVSRSASVCIAYLVKYRNMSLRQAYYHVLNKRPCIFPNFGFWRQLVEYELQLRGSSSVMLLPFIFGMVPDTFIRDAEYRLRFGWTQELCSYFLLHFLIMVSQVIYLLFT